MPSITVQIDTAIARSIQIDGGVIIIAAREAGRL